MTGSLGPARARATGQQQRSGGSSSSSSSSSVRRPAPAHDSRRGPPPLQASLQASHAAAAAAAATALSGLLLASQPQPAAAAAPLPHGWAVLLDGNPAVLSDLRRLAKAQQAQQRLGSQPPGEALAARFRAAEQQLSRVELLVKLEQHDEARLVLRQGAFSSLRMDLGYGQEVFRVLQPQAGRAVVEAVEKLDGQLKRREGLESVKPQLELLRGQLDGMATLLADTAPQ